MCRDCFECGIHGFETAAEFTDFETALALKLSTKQLAAVGRPSPKSPVAYDADESYECLSCQEFWFLATPDNAWRGYFLPAKSTLAYQRELQGSDKRIQLTGLLLFALALAALALWLLK
jgi:hypothetical protein